jgi:transcription antitermination factor NusG
MDASNVYTQWFALQVKPRFEKNTSLLLREKGFEEFLPLYRCRRRWRHRNAVIELPLFPGYLFCRFDLRDRMPVLTTPGVFSIVSTAKVPARIPDEEIESIRRVVCFGRNVEPFPYVEGQNVRIEDGPLRSVEGTIVQVKKSQRIVVSIKLLQRSVAAEVGPDCKMVVLGAARAGAN